MSDVKSPAESAAVPEPDPTALRALDDAAVGSHSLRGSRIFRYLGPGLLVAMAGVGTSHLVTAPLAGAHFEFALLWV
ncbi:MAG: Nramp family divalent metal transporter, partial [Stackebrandtia sp.]